MALLELLQREHAVTLVTGRPFDCERLNGAYHISGPGRDLRVNITVTVGLVQYNDGESSEQLFRRVDESMYGRKHSASDSSP